ncbi:MAG: hypothetical protein M0Q46_06155 [Endomicrobiales bacterium]|nr:hypothetical protein [Endomicrobiales bacterium]
MKKLLGILFLLFFTTQAHAIFGLEKIRLFEADLQLMKQDITTKENESNVVKAEMNGKIVGLESKIEKLELKLNAQGNVIAGFNNKTQNQVAGRDIKSTVVNDSELLKFIFDKWAYIIGGLFGFILSILTGVWGIVQFVMAMNERLLNAKDKMIDDLNKRNSAKEEKLNDWQNEMLEKVINKKGAV